MADYNPRCDPNFYPNSTARKVYRYTSLNKSSVVKPVHGQCDETQADHRGMVPQQGPMPGPSTNLLPTKPFGNDLCNPSVGRCLTRESPGSVTDATSFENEFSEETSDVTHVPSRQNIHNSSNPNHGPTRGVQTPTLQFEPVRPWRARRLRVVTHRSREVDPLTQEGSANAVSSHKITEENEIPKPKKARKPYGTGKPQVSRKIGQDENRELRDLVKRWKKLDSAPTWNTTLAHVLEYITKVREAVYQRPCLVKRERGPLPEGSRGVKKARENRNLEGAMFEEFSRYYRLPEKFIRDDGEVMEHLWERPSLVREILLDLNVRYPPPELLLDSTP